MDLEVTQDQSKRRFTASIEGVEAYVAYAPRNDNGIDFHYTFVPERLRHRKVGRALVREAARQAAEQGLEVTASCGFAAQVLADASD